MKRFMAKIGCDCGIEFLCCKLLGGFLDQSLIFGQLLGKLKWILILKFGKFGKIASRKSGGKTSDHE